MNIKVAFLIVVVLSIQSAALTAAPSRSSTVKRDFQRQNPCPSTGKTKGACPGYVKDHIKPLACGGADAVENMQWQTREEAKVKDEWERGVCKKSR